MPRRWRKDYPGAWHHVMNRGVARRTLFENRRDVRFFLSLLARQVRSGNLEVHAYAVLTTHFHLLVRSPEGVLSSAMQRILDAYARWFNRGRRRDGPLFRGRFTNRLVETEAYWGNVVAYIDRNPVDAGLVGRASRYPYGSAFHYARGKGPPWLRRDLVESWTMGFGEGQAYDPARYGGPGDEGTGLRWLVERRLQQEASGAEDPLDDLAGAAAPRVRDWMERKARLGDGPAAGWILVSPQTVGSCLGGRRRACPGWGIELDDRAGAGWGWDVLEAGVLRWFCGLKSAEVALRLGLPRTTCQERVARFALAFERSAGFRAMAAEVLTEALAEDQGSRGPRAGLEFWKRQRPLARAGDLGTKENRCQGAGVPVRRGCPGTGTAENPAVGPAAGVGFGTP